jgi:hypothetical protein
VPAPAAPASPPSAQASSPAPEAAPAAAPAPVPQPAAVPHALQIRTRPGPPPGWAPARCLRRRRLPPRRRTGGAKGLRRAGRRAPSRQPNPRRSFKLAGWTPPERATRGRRGAVPAPAAQAPAPSPTPSQAMPRHRRLSFPPARSADPNKAFVPPAGWTRREQATRVAAAGADTGAGTTQCPAPRQTAACRRRARRFRGAFGRSIRQRAAGGLTPPGR